MGHTYKPNYIGLFFLGPSHLPELLSSNAYRAIDYVNIISGAIQEEFFEALSDLFSAFFVYLLRIIRHDEQLVDICLLYYWLYFGCAGIDTKHGTVLVFLYRNV